MDIFKSAGKIFTKLWTFVGFFRIRGSFLLQKKFTGEIFQDKFCPLLIMPALSYIAQALFREKAPKVSLRNPNQGEGHTVSEA